MNNPEKISKKELVKGSGSEAKLALSFATFFIWLLLHWPFVQFLMTLGIDQKASIYISVATLASIIGFGWVSKNGYTVLLSKLERFRDETVSRLNILIPDAVKTYSAKAMLACASLIVASMAMLQFTDLQLNTARILAATYPKNAITTWEIRKETHDGIYISVVFNPVDQGYRLLCGEEPCYLQLEYRVTDESVSSLKPLILDIDSAAASGILLKDGIALTKVAQGIGSDRLARDQFMFNVFLSHGVLGLSPHSPFATIAMPVAVLFAGLMFFCANVRPIKKLISSFFCLVLVSSIACVPLINLYLVR